MPRMLAAPLNAAQVVRTRARPMLAGAAGRCAVERTPARRCWRRSWSLRSRARGARLRSAGARRPASAARERKVIRAPTVRPSSGPCRSGAASRSSSSARCPFELEVDHARGPFLRTDRHAARGAERPQRDRRRVRARRDDRCAARRCRGHRGSSSGNAVEPDRRVASARAAAARSTSRTGAVRPRRSQRRDPEPEAREQPRHVDLASYIIRRSDCTARAAERFEPRLRRTGSITAVGSASSRRVVEQRPTAGRRGEAGHVASRSLPRGVFKRARRWSQCGHERGARRLVHLGHLRNTSLRCRGPSSSRSTNAARTASGPWPGIPTCRNGAHSSASPPRPRRDARAATTSAERAEARAEARVVRDKAEQVRAAQPRAKKRDGSVRRPMRRRRPATLPIPPAPPILHTLPSRAPRHPAHPAGTTARALLPLRFRRRGAEASAAGPARGGAEGGLQQGAGESGARAGIAMRRFLARVLDTLTLGVAARASVVVLGRRIHRRSRLHARAGAVRAWRAGAVRVVPLEAIARVCSARRPAGADALECGATTARSPTLPSRSVAGAPVVPRARARLALIGFITLIAAGSRFVSSGRTRGTAISVSTSRDADRGVALAGRVFGAFVAFLVLTSGSGRRRRGAAGVLSVAFPASTCHNRRVPRARPQARIVRCTGPDFPQAPCSFRLRRGPDRCRRARATRRDDLRPKHDFHVTLSVVHSALDSPQRSRAVTSPKGARRRIRALDWTHDDTMRSSAAQAKPEVLAET